MKSTHRLLATGLAASMSTGSLSLEVAKPPVARREARVVTFGRVEGENRGPNAMDPPKVLIDDYFWLRDDNRESPEVMALLRAENAYTEARTQHLENLQAALYDEMLSHVKEDDESVPYEMADGYEYFSRTLKGEPFRQYVRRRPDNFDEEIYLDVNVFAKAMCKKPEMCDIGQIKPSPSGDLVAFTFDDSGYETYDVRIRRIDNYTADDEILKETAGVICWGGDDSTLYYVEHNKAHRPYRCWRHRVGSPQSDDELIYEEVDERFNVACWRESDGAMVLIESESKETTELRLVSLDQPNAAPRLVRPRQDGVQYTVSSHAPSRRIFVTSNAFGKVNRAVYCASVDAPGDWHELVPHSDTRSLTGAVIAFRDFVAVSGRETGFAQVWTFATTPYEPQGFVALSPVFAENAGSTVGLASSGNRLFESSKLRVTYSSMMEPRSVLDFSYQDASFKELKVDPVPNYEKSLYATERVECLVSDGSTRVPITLLWRPDRCTEQPPVHLYGYGSYGISIDPTFSATRLPLVDRGIVYAIAHVRGGGEGGKWNWYESQGKYLAKKNTFSDFVDCARYLKSEKYPGSDISIEGRSAGGLLVGNACNMAPSLFKACLAGVPFVDLMTTMCDPSIPLTTEEWNEWGNPNELKFFDYMLSYSPINQVQQDVTYPEILIVSGLNDPRVAYWEPTKWAQVLRASIGNGEDVLLKMDLDAGTTPSSHYVLIEFPLTGHFSASDRYRYLKELAFDFAWLLEKHGKESVGLQEN